VTYSIVARDAETGELGVAVQSCYFAVGSVVPSAQAGVGVVATQSFADPSFGPVGLELLDGGRTATEVMAALVAMDGGAAARQVAIVDAAGGTAVHTGSACVGEAGHVVGDGYVVAANMMGQASVWPAMAAAFEQTNDDLSVRLLAALDAAEAEGGDMRGRQSAAMVIVGADRTGPALGRRLDLRVDDHAEPLGELRRLVRAAQAHVEFDRVVELVGELDLDGAMAAVSRALQLRPQFVDAAVARVALLAIGGQLDDAREFARTWPGDRVAMALTMRRMVASGLVPLDDQTVDAVLQV
jgi:uncharacterized Ntn-hydrolase superfamily protein